VAVVNEPMIPSHLPDPGICSICGESGDVHDRRQHVLTQVFFAVTAVVLLAVCGLFIYAALIAPRT